MSCFDRLEMLPEDPIFGLVEAFNADKNPHKVNLSVGTYKNKEGAGIIFSSVKKAEAILLKNELHKDYLPIVGDPTYIREALKLIFGETLLAQRKNQVFAAQTIGGTGALRINAELFFKMGCKRIFVPSPTWPNHNAIFHQAGLTILEFPYYNPENHSLDFSKMCEAIQKMGEGDIIVLQECCHNPTGMDPTFDQWKELSEIIKKRRVLPFFDLAYQGLGKGLEEDVRSLRYFVQMGHEIALSNSFAKNFGVYGERVGLLALITNSDASDNHQKTRSTKIKKIASNVKHLIRSSYSNPAKHGASIVATILQSEDLRKEWENELTLIRQRVQDIRLEFVNGLITKGFNKDLSFLKQQQGLFSFIGLTPNQVKYLMEHEGIYMLENSRINVAGLNRSNLEYTINAIHALEVKGIH